LVDNEQIDAVLDPENGVGDAAMDLLVLVAAHHKRIGQRQHRDGDPASA
jgi:hypothetical protein